ncbi:MAG: 1-deoxy-D-xylulose-5-phosphate reductoisomerase [Bacteroidota bacterium]|nr:1-deoxy-D-xylulose-5-phosphate reductoisomerase [Bacteroidota bacterium]
MKKHIAVIGSTGSIGTQALDVIRKNPELFEVEVLTACTSTDLLIRQAIEFKPNAIVVGKEEHYLKVADALKSYPVKVFAGVESISQIVEMESIDLVLNSLVGFAGLRPTLNAIRAGKDIALANKESLVVGGDLIMKEARKNRVMILPVDSEHSAIFQCLAGEQNKSVEKIILTASGGPFRGKDMQFLSHIKKEEALKHPNWKMGKKVTIDSASLMNKGLEVIEARWLFNVPSERIEVVIHPQSIIHSMVQFVDGSVKAQLGVPDMRLPILYALGYPGRLSSDFNRLNFSEIKEFTFESPDKKLFRNLGLAYEALAKGGNMPCVLNAANEIAVKAFLEDRISFLGMPVLIEECLNTIPFIKEPSLEDYIQTNKETCKKAVEILHLHNNI